MKSIWPGQPGGYVPIAYISLMKAAALKERALVNHKKQNFLTNRREDKK